MQKMMQKNDTKYYVERRRKKLMRKMMQKIDASFKFNISVANKHSHFKSAKTSTAAICIAKYSQFPS